MQKPSEPDFRALFESAPGLYLVLLPDAPRYTIVAVSDAYARQTRTTRQGLLGRGLFDVFPDNPDDPEATGVRNLSASLGRVITARAPDAMAVQKYDIRRPAEEGGGFEERWWSPVNSPVFGPSGELVYLLHRVEDMTEFIRVKLAGQEAQRQREEVQTRVEHAESELFLRGRQLQEANERLREANDELARAQAVARIGSWRLDLAKNELRWSEETYRIFGVAKGTPLTFEAFLACVHPDDREELGRCWSAALRGEAYDVQHRIVVGGETRWVRERSEPLLDARRVAVGTVQDITDLKQIDEALRTKEQQRRELFEGAPDGVFVAGPDGRYTDVNAADCRMLGYAREELVGRPLTEFVAPGDVQRQAALARRLHEGAVEVAEWRLRRKDGSYVAVELSGSALPDGRLLAFARDITDRREAEERISLSEAKFSGIVSISADAIVSIDDAQRITFFNEGAEKIFGYTRAEVLGAPLETLIPERMRAAHRAHVERFARGQATARRMGEPTSAIVGLRKNGEEFPADAAISKLDVGGRRILTAALRDITEHKRIEREERFFSEAGVLLAATLDAEEIVANIARLVVELADWCVVYVVGDDGSLRRLTVLSADPEKRSLAEAFQRLPVERDRPHLVSEVMASMAPSIVPVVSPEMLQSMAQSDEHHRLFEALGVASMMAVPLAAHGRVLGALLAVSSTTRHRFGPADLRVLAGLGQRATLSLENARLYRAQQRAVEARDRVLAIVAHDLRNPLNTIILQARLVQRQGQKQDAQYAEVITRSAQRMNRLIQDLLDVACAESDGLPIACRAASPREILAAAAEVHALLAAEAGLDIRVDASGDLPEVWVDPGRILQVFSNLVGNALKFTPRGGTITLGASTLGARVQFRVEDTGSGIPEAYLPHVFDRFWQAKRTDRRGAGLGLAIAKSIVESHGGQIAVESKPGCGTTFRFTVPVATRAARGLDESVHAARHE